MLKFWKVCKSTEFRASISLQPTGLQKDSLWAGSSYGGLLNLLSAALEATPETGCRGRRWPVPAKGGTMTQLGLAGWPDTGLVHGKAQHYQRLFIIKESAFIC